MYFIFPIAVQQRGRNSNVLKNILIIFPKVYFATPWKLRSICTCMQMFSSSLSFVLTNYISVLCPSLPVKTSFVFFPLLVLGLSTGIHNDTCWWKQGENAGADLFCSVSVVPLLALDLVACICLMNHGCFNLQDCPCPRSISSLLEIESWLSNVPVIIVIKTVPLQQRPKQRVIW